MRLVFERDFTFLKITQKTLFSEYRGEEMTEAECGWFSSAISLFLKITQKTLFSYTKN